MSEMYVENMLNIFFKIQAITVLIAKGLFQITIFLLGTVWWFTRFLFAIGEHRDSESDEIEPPKLSIKAKSIPEVTDDSSNSEEETVDDNKMALNPKQELEQYTSTIPEKNKHEDIVLTTTPSGFEENQLRKRNQIKEHCQVCGRKPAIIHCEGPRCYTHFCSECDDLYHQHPRRTNHKRESLSTYTSRVKQIFSSDTALKDSSASKAQEFALEGLSQMKSCQSYDNQASRMPEPSDGTTWTCKFCTFVNEISDNICRVCCKTNYKLLDASAEKIPEVTPSIETRNKTSTELTDRNTTKEDFTHSGEGKNTLYDHYWANQKKSASISTSNTNSTSSSRELPKSKQAIAPDRGTVNKSSGGRGNGNHQRNTDNKSSRGRGNGNHQRNKPLKSNDNQMVVEPQQELPPVDVVSAVHKEDELPSSVGSSSVWICGFCTLENEPTVKICNVCGKSQNVNISELNLPNKIPQPSESSNQSDRSLLQTDVAGNFEHQAEIDVIALNFMENNHIENYEVAKLASKLVKQNFKLNDAIEAAKNCSNLNDALVYLQQDCPICTKQFHTRELIQMPNCTHRFCQHCTRRHFSRQIRTNEISSFVCPLCKTPNLSEIVTSNNDVSEYFANLADILKPIIDAEDLEMYQEKLRNWFLKNHPNFWQCPNCPFGGIQEDQHLNYMACPECKFETCLKCKRIWIPAHYGVSCEYFAAQQENAKKTGSKKNKKKEEKGFFRKMFSTSSSPGCSTTTDDLTSEQRRSESYADAITSKLDHHKRQKENGTRNTNTAFQQNASQFPQLPNPQSQQPTSSSTHYLQNTDFVPTSSNPPNSTGRNQEQPPYRRNPVGSIPNYNTGAVNTGNPFNSAQTGTQQGDRSHKNSYPYQSEASQQSAEYLTPATWTCKYCTMSNEGGVRVCGVCGKSLGYIQNDDDRNVDSKLLTSAHDSYQKHSSNISDLNIEPSEDALQHIEEVSGRYEREGGSSTISLENLNAKFTEAAISSPDLITASTPHDSMMDWEQISIPSSYVNHQYSEQNYVPNNNGQTIGVLQEVSNNNSPTLHMRSTMSTLPYNERSIAFYERLNLMKEANALGFCEEEVDIALSQCRCEDALQWLLKRWQYDITYVKLITIRKLQELGDFNSANILAVTNLEARMALINQKGDCSKAIAVCVENSFKKFGEQQTTETSNAVAVTSSPQANCSQVEQVGIDRIISHQELVSRNLALINSSRIHQHQQQLGSGNANSALLPGVHGNTSLVQTIKSRFLLHDKTVDRPSQTVTQITTYPSLQHPTIVTRSQTQLYPGNQNRNARTADGLHEARPAMNEDKEDDGF